ncbi:glucoamylase family protein [Dyella sp. GSA-30]|uniref:glucoamylase family protein n=1 Tax=Dyella sp. GSA-30 TaxID=2994496 RepID=UPI002493C05F|nr:glucoamylase family protein [Dyella sp. GSA-30]BDU19279.1 hypothetical protein DYGSA30_07360 [Dyella sp. GSA-30]
MRLNKPTRLTLVLATALTCLSPVAAQAKKTQAAPTHQQADSKRIPPAIDDLEKRTFSWFWDSANPVNGLIPDHYPTDSFASIASVGFGLTAYGVGVERGYITRDQAIERTLTTLKFFRDAPQNDSEDDATGFHGFFYHFLNMQTGKREARWVELSTVDTTLLMGGVLFAQSYYDRDTPKEKEIREIADELYRRIEWSWAQPRAPLISMGWTPGGKFIPHDWTGYNEGMLVYILALGSPTHPVSDDAWAAWSASYKRTWGTFYGQEHLGFAPLFGHQFSHVWVDFRGIRDAWGREKNLDYFENSRRATYSQRAYAMANPGNCTGYGKDIWGLTASNGPGGYIVLGAANAQQPKFFGYTARGAGIDYIQDDCTIVPTAAGSSIAFAPEIVVPALEEMKKRYGKYIYNKYGFVDAFNPSFHVPNVQLRTGRMVPEMGWADTVQLGLDQGPIVLMIENWRSDFVWNVMKKNPYIRKGLERAGFTGGWLSKDAAQP